VYSPGFPRRIQTFACFFLRVGLKANILPAFLALRQHLAADHNQGPNPDYIRTAKKLEEFQVITDHTKLPL